MNGTWLRKENNTYSVDPANLKSRWIYPSEVNNDPYASQVMTGPWDLFSKSLLIYISVEERDDAQTIVETHTVSNEFVSKANFSVGSTLFKILKLDLGGGFENKVTKTSTMTVTTTVGSDKLGTIVFDYRRPIILSDSEKGTKGYKVYTESTGSAEIMLLPVKVR